MKENDSKIAMIVLIVLILLVFLFTWLKPKYAVVIHSGGKETKIMVPEGYKLESHQEFRGHDNFVILITFEEGGDD